jgi:prepilin-type N-terminal cleavage/methylation domain-containing protein
MISRAEPRGAARRRARGAGFTLVELLVALTIAALLLAALPGASGVLPRVRFDRASHDLVAALRTARALAVGAGQPATISFDPRALTWTASTDGITHRLAPAVERLQLELASPVAAADPARIRFMADGTASAATLRLWGGGRAASIRVEWASGQVRLHD